MATITRKLLKGGAIVGSVPAFGIYLGYQMRAQQALAAKSEDSRVYKVSEIPLYNTSSDTHPKHIAEIYPRNQLESGIGNVRMKVQEVVNTVVLSEDAYELYPRNKIEAGIGSIRCTIEEYYKQTIRPPIWETYQWVEDKYNIGVAHTQASIDYIQNENSNEVVRIVTITVAGLGGLVLGYRRSILRKMLYFTIAGGSMASLCYPKQTVELSKNMYEGTISLYNQLTSPSEEPNQVEVVNEVQAEEISKDNTDEEISEDTETVLVEKVKMLKGDPGQSNPEDQDMYSTRSS